MKSDAQPVSALPSGHAEKRPLNPWLLVCGVGLVFLALVIGGLLLLALIAPKQALQANEVQMPDGKVLRIEGITWGKDHRINYEYSPSGSWGFWDRRMMPLTQGTGYDQLVVWMSCHDARTGRALDFDWWSSSVAIDAHGDEVADHDPYLRQMGAHGSSFGGGARPFRSERGQYNTWLVSSSFPAFRTDGGRFKLQVRNLAGNVVAEMELTHPSPPADQPWNPDVLPATQTNGDVAVTLNRLLANFHWSTENGLKKKYWYYSPEATVSENGQPAANWYVSLLELTDPLGNRQTYGQSLSIHEPTWKLRLAACRAQDSKFSDAETWTLTDLPIPEKETASPRSDSKNIEGVTVTLVALAGLGKTNYSIATPSNAAYGNFSSSSGGSAFGSSTKVETKRNGSSTTSTVEANWPHLTLEASGLTQSHRLYLLAKDDQGRSVETQQSYNYGALQSFFFKTEADAKSLSLSIFVHKGREFEFIVKPPELPAEKPMP